MKKWKHTLNFKDLLPENPTQEGAQELGEAIAKRVERLASHKDFEDDMTLEDVVHGLGGISSNLQWQNLCIDEPHWRGNPPIEELDGWLEQLYDFCDDNNIWCK